MYYHLVCNMNLLALGNIQPLAIRRLCTTIWCVCSPKLAATSAALCQLSVTLTLPYAMVVLMLGQRLR